MGRLYKTLLVFLCLLVVACSNSTEAPQPNQATQVEGKWQFKTLHSVYYDVEGKFLGQDNPNNKWTYIEFKGNIITISNATSRGTGTFAISEANNEKTITLKEVSNLEEPLQTFVITSLQASQMTWQYEVPNALYIVDGRITTAYRGVYTYQLQKI